MAQKEEHALLEVYVENTGEAMSAWQEIRGESAAWGRYLKSQAESLFDKNGLLTKEARDLILETYLAGPSRRRVGMVLKRVLGYKVSASTVSAICKGLDALVRKYWRSPIGDNWRYPPLDAIVMKNRSCVGSEKWFIQVAVGISRSGERKIPSFRQVESESEICWQSFVDDLVCRGLAYQNGQWEASYHPKQFTHRA